MDATQLYPESRRGTTTRSLHHTLVPLPSSPLPFPVGPLLFRLIGNGGSHQASSPSRVTWPVAHGNTYFEPDTMAVGWGTQEPGADPRS
jgi:hypothetical protein